MTVTSSAEDVCSLRTVSSAGLTSYGVCWMLKSFLRYTADRPGSSSLDTFSHFNSKGRRGGIMVKPTDSALPSRVNEKQLSA